MVCLLVVLVLMRAYTMIMELFPDMHILFWPVESSLINMDKKSVLCSSEILGRRENGTVDSQTRPMTGLHNSRES